MANKTAREEFLSEYNETLGKIVSVHSQVVSGLRYKIVYESDLGRVETSLWVQVWLHRVKLEYFKFLDNQTKLASDNASATENSGTKTVVANKETGTEQVQKNVADVPK